MANLTGPEAQAFTEYQESGRENFGDADELGAAREKLGFVPADGAAETHFEDDGSTPPVYSETSATMGPEEMEAFRQSGKSLAEWQAEKAKVEESVQGEQSAEKEQAEIDKLLREFADLAEQHRADAEKLLALNRRLTDYIRANFPNGLSMDDAKRIGEFKDTLADDAGVPVRKEFKYGPDGTLIIDGEDYANNANPNASFGRGA